MVLLIAFAFLAGAGTAVSPCVLPVLPLVLSAGVTGGRRRPLGIVNALETSHAAERALAGVRGTSGRFARPAGAGEADSGLLAALGLTSRPAHGVIADGVSDRQPCAVQTALERRLAQPQHRGRLGGREAFDVAQDQRRAVLERERADGARERRPKLGTSDSCVRLLPEVVWIDRTVLVERGDERSRRLALEPAFRLVESDPVEPGEEARLAFERADSAPRSQERFLRDLLGRFAGQSQPPHDRVEMVGVPTNELLERRSIPAPGLRHERAVWIVRPRPIVRA
jgi:hypothetical protein